MVEAMLHEFSADQGQETISRSKVPTQSQRGWSLRRAAGTVDAPTPSLQG